MFMLQDHSPLQVLTNVSADKLRFKTRLTLKIKIGALRFKIVWPHILKSTNRTDPNLPHQYPDEQVIKQIQLPCTVMFFHSITSAWFKCDWSSSYTSKYVFCSIFYKFYRIFVYNDLFPSHWWHVSNTACFMEELKAQTFWKIIQSTEEKQTWFHSRNANWIASCENKQLKKEKENSKDKSFQWAPQNTCTFVSWFQPLNSDQRKELSE